MFIATAGPSLSSLVRLLSASICHFSKTRMEKTCVLSTGRLGFDPYFQFLGRFAFCNRPQVTCLRVYLHLFFSRDPREVAKTCRLIRTDPIGGLSGLAIRSTAGVASG